MNDARPTEASQAAEFASPADGHLDHAPNSPSPDLRRRRLIRGAAGVAPVVLTLRSGALLAASSCTGAMTVTTTDSSTGYFPGVIGMAQGDACVKNFNTAGCAVGGNKILSAVDEGYTVNDEGSGNWSCKNGTNIVKNQSIAVLSGAAVTSLTGSGNWSA